ncbi:hypothetical protein [Tenacibaculum sp. UWU-22]|uniref:hypothetical protein n=1 Tax=Tenacibaculum sp. UWU-22 TaxID=3234187 RepID=UPI0034DB07CB
MKFYIACIQKLKEQIEMVANKKSLFVACPSLRVFEANDFEFLSGKKMDAETFLNSEDISIQLNSMSTNSTYWDVDPQINIYEHYKQCLEQINLKEKKTIQASVENEAKILYKNNKEPSEELELYNQKMEEYDLLIDELNSLYIDYDSASIEEEKKVFLMKVDVLEKKIALHLANWKLNGAKDKIEAALESLNKLSEYDQFLALKQKVISDLKSIEATGIQSTSVYAKLQMIPYNFYENENTWNTLELDYTELEATFNRAKNNLKGFNVDIFDFDYDESFIKKITLNYCIVSIKRPWLKNELLTSNFTTAKSERTAYIYAEKIALVKDLRVILKDLTIAEKTEIQNNSFIKFGPIFMKNQFFLNKVSRESFIKPIVNKKIYRNNMVFKIDKKLMATSSQLMPTKKAVNSKLTTPLNRKSIQKKQAISQRKTVFKPMHMIRNVNIKPGSAKIMNKASLKPLPFKAAMVFNPVWINTQHQSNIFITVVDKLTKDGVYKTEISIKNKNTSYLKVVETNEEGFVKCVLPKGTYDVNIRKNGYKEFNFVQAVSENKNVTINKNIEPQEVVYDSYFLMGVIAKQIVL